MPLTVVSSRTDSGLLMASPGQNLAKTPENPEIHEIPGALEMATGKGAGIAKDNFAAFVKFNPFRRPWKPEIQEIQGALEMASGKGAGIAKSTSLMLLWCSPRFGGLGSRKNKKYKRKGAGIANSTALHFGGLGSRKSRISKRPWKLRPEKERVLQNRQNWCFCGVPPFRRPWKPEIQEIQWPWKWQPIKERVLQNRRFLCFSCKQEIQEITNYNREKSEYCKIGNFGAFVGFLPFRRPWKP